MYDIFSNVKIVIFQYGFLDLSSGLFIHCKLLLETLITYPNVIREQNNQQIKYGLYALELRLQDWADCWGIDWYHESISV